VSYRRVFDADGADSLAKLARWIRPGSSVLELGAATGYFTEHLHSLGCTVDIVEVDAAAASEARRFARRTVVADLDADAWVREIGGARYDTIICADVIEHLRDGEGLLARLRPLLADDGELLLSVPNVAHSALIAGLLDEQFEYGGEGLLDPTHLKLYTWRSLATALDRAGYAVRAWDATTVAPFETEFRVRSESLDPALRVALTRRPHAFVYQWLVRAVAGHDEAGLVAPPAVEEVEHVPVRLLYGVDAAALSLDRALTARVPLGGARVTLEWSLASPARALRLVLADRVGVIEVHSLVLAADGEILWTGAADAAHVVLGPAALRVGDHAFALTAPDAWIAPDAPPEVVARADRLSAVLAWPAGITADGSYTVFTALAQARDSERAAAGRHADALLATVRALERQIDAERAAGSGTRESLARRDGDVRSLEAAVAASKDEIARLEAAAAAQERIIAYRQSLRWWITLPLLRARLWWRRLVGR
jgi:2-polyprenyl-3-methyl-5-hydroxy-6-metoxy-1,4-benzoquinol methylase